MSDERRIRVMHVLPWLDSGGVERRRAQLAVGLDPDRFEQRLVCMYAKEYEFAKIIRDAGVEVVSFDSGRGSIFDVDTIWRVVEEIRRFSPDIIHGAVFEGMTLAALAGTLGDVPRIVIEETGDPSIRSWRGDTLLALIARLADVAIGVSPPITDYLSNRLHLGSDRVALIMNGVDPPRKPARTEVVEFRASLGFEPGDFVVGSAGRIDDDHKRFSDLIESLSTLASEIPELKLMIVGNGRDIPMLEELAARRGVADRVVMTGYQADMGLAYHSMDVFALASRQESFGLVIAEAMHCGRPILATHVGGIPYIVDDRDTGLLVPPLRPDLMAERLMQLHAEPALRDALGIAGARKARQQFGARRYVRDVERLYLRLMPEARP